MIDLLIDYCKDREESRKDELLKPSDRLRWLDFLI